MISKALYSSRTDEWSTPDALFQELDKEFHFNLDPCCTDENAKCKKHFTAADNGLAQDWGGIAYSVIPHMEGRSATG